MRTLLIVAIALALATAHADEGHHHALTAVELGSVHFQNSCQPGLGQDFDRAVALLHSFQYEQARGTFSAITAADPQCALAWWGIAMTHYHGMWGNGDPARGRAAIEKAKQAAVENDMTTARERAYIAALDEIYKDPAQHPEAFEQEMAALQAAYPGDVEAAVFHAMSLAITAPKTDKTFANQRKCGEILEPLFVKFPHHPGVAHYIIHCYDNPVLATQGLAAARSYARIAPASAHAQHMPSHLFTRAGLWDEAIESNRKAAAMAAQAEKISLNGEARDQRLHAMDYLEYAYLQSGKISQAAAVLAELKVLTSAPGKTRPGDYAESAIPARYALERGDWKRASELKVNHNAEPWTQAITWQAIGEGSARSGNPQRAEAAEQALVALSQTLAKANPYWSQQVEVQRQEVAAWRIAPASPADLGRAIAQMRAAADLEESMDKSPVTPGAVVPAREMLAELLLQAKQPARALVEYQAVLKTAPNRFNALYGAGAAAEQAGDNVSAAAYFKKLTEIASGNERPELAQARKKIMLAMQ